MRTTARGDPVSIVEMPVIARDAVASDHLVFAWPFPIGPEEYEVACADDELVVMCPSFTVGDRLGPGRHRWRTPDPMRPASAYFVLTAPVEVSFDMITQFVIPATGQPVRIRASGSLQVRCTDPALLVAQFVGLPFDHVNDGIMRSVSRSVERMLARLLTRRVVMAGTPNAVTDPQMLPNIIEELVAYNPAAGAVFGIELVRMGHVTILADDGSRPWHQMGMDSSPSHHHLQVNGGAGDSHLMHPVPGRGSEPNLVETARGTLKPRAHTQPPVEASGEIVIRTREKSNTIQGHAAASPDPQRVITTPVPQRNAGAIDVPAEADEETKPGLDMSQRDTIPTPPEPRAAILGIGVSPIGSEPTPAAAPASPEPSATAGDTAKKIPPGGRVLVPGPGGLMQSATVRQLLQGYYELEVGGSGETIWVPVNGVVPE